MEHSIKDQPSLNYFLYFMYRPTFIVNIIKNDNEREREIYSDLTYNKKNE